MMFAELDVGGLKVRIPFVCRMCGECCRRLSKVIYDPRLDRIYMEDLDFEYFEGIEEYRDFQHPIKVTCPFLRDNRCTIYKIRPRSCREFPLLTGDLGVDCPALRSFKKFLDAFNPDKVIYSLDDDVDPIAIPGIFFELFKSLNPTKDELDAFLRLNRVEKSLNFLTLTKFKGP